MSLCYPSMRRGLRSSWDAQTAITLQVLAAEAVFFGKRASRKVVAAIVIVCLGVGLSTVTDTQVRL